MKNSLKRALCALLALLAAAVLLSIGGCSSTKKLLGSWDWDIYVPPETFGLDGLENGVTLSMVFTFNEDGSYALGADETVARPAWTEFITGVVDYAVNAAYQSGEEQGVDRDTFDSTFTAMYGMSLREYMQSAVDEQADYDSTVGQLAMDGEYAFKDGKLYVWETGGEIDEEVYFDYTYKNDTLTLLDTTDPDYTDDTSLIEFPIEMTRRAAN